MSQENVEVIRAMYEAWQRGDESWVGTLADDVEWDFSAYPLPDVEDHGRGFERFLRFLVGYVGSWAEYNAAVGEVLAGGGDRVLVVVHESIKAGGSDVAIERDIFHVWTMQNEKAARLRSFRTRREALEAAGLSE